MAIVNSSETRVALIKESTWNTTPPTTPVFLTARVTGESLNLVRGTVVSDEIRSDRNVADLIQVSGGARGGFNLEMSYGGTGSWLDAILESVMYNTFATNNLTNGISQQPMTIEKTYEAGATDVFVRHTGMVANTFNLEAVARQKVTASVDFLGGGGSTGSAILTGATYTAAPTGAIMQTSTGFASLSMTGITSPKVMSVRLAVNNNLREQPVLASLYSAGIGSGRFEVTGSVEFYLENSSIIDLFLAGTATSLSFTIGTVTAEKYTFNCPNIELENVQHSAGGNDADVMLRADFRALYNSGISGTMRITRAVA